MEPWSLAVPDWRERIRTGRTLLPELPHLVARLAEVARDMEIVKQDGSLRRLLLGDVAEWLPYGRHAKSQALYLPS